MIIKAIAVATMAIAASPTFAVAEDSYFSVTEPIDRGHIVNLGLVRAEADGIVEIYNYHLGRPGELLGTVFVRRGANSDVRVLTQQVVRSNVFAELKVNGKVVAQAKYPIHRER